MKKTIAFTRLILLITSIISSFVFSIVIILNLLKFQILHIGLSFLCMILLILFSFIFFGKKQLNDKSKIFDFFLYFCLSSLAINFIYMLIFFIFNLSFINFLSILLSIVNLVAVTLFIGDYLYSFTYEI